MERIDVHAFSHAEARGLGGRYPAETMRSDSLFMSCANRTAAAERAIKGLVKQDRVIIIWLATDTQSGLYGRRNFPGAWQRIASVDDRESHGTVKRLHHASNRSSRNRCDASGLRPNEDAAPVLIP